MVSVFSHAVAAVALGATFPRSALPRRAWIVGALAAAAPDLDYFLHVAGVPYSSPYGHRGFTHSLTFALVLGAVVALAVPRRWPGSRATLLTYVALATASHGVLDAMTDGGHGIAFFWPLSDQRWFLPWRPLGAAPLSIRGFFTAHGLDVMAGELVAVWLPAAVVALVGLAWHAARRRRSGAGTATAPSS